MDFFLLKGKGLLGYISGIFELKKRIKTNPYQVYHAHYLLTGLAVSVANPKPLVVSLMGSDVLSNSIFAKLSGFFSRHFWDLTIVKSKEMKIHLNNPEVEVVPNGVDLDFFKPLDKIECRQKLKWSKEQIHLLFVGDPSQKVKGFELADQAINRLNYPNIEVHILKNIPPHELPLYYNAADVAILTSHKEGSPNVIKEAMACNCPIVSTDVGDVKEIISGTKGCFVAGHNPIEISEAIELAIGFNKKTNGREAIQSLDANKIAKKLISLYESING